MKHEGLDLEAQIADLGAEDWNTRHSAFRALAEQGASAIEVLIAGTEHPNWRVRRECADLMDHLADNRCVDSLVRLLNDPVIAVRRLALHALSCQGCKVCPLEVDIVAHLSRLALEDKSIAVQRVAVHQLGCQPPTPRAKQTLQQILAERRDPKLLSRARWALEQQIRVQ